MTTIELFLILFVFFITNIAWGVFVYVILKVVKNEVPFPKKEKVAQVDRFVPLEEVTQGEIQDFFDETLRKINVNAAGVKPE